MLSTTAKTTDRELVSATTASRVNPRNKVGHSAYSDNRFKQVPIVQELCEGRGGRPGLSVLTSLLVPVDVKLY